MIYVHNKLKFKKVSVLSESVENIYECVSIEIETVKNKKYSYLVHVSSSGY